MGVLARIERAIVEGEVEIARARWVPRECVRARLGKKSRLSEVAESEGSLVLENVEVVLILVSENDGISNMNSRVLPLRNSIHEDRRTVTHFAENREEEEEEEAEECDERCDLHRGNERFLYSFLQAEAERDDER